MTDKITKSVWRVEIWSRDHVGYSQWETAEETNNLSRACDCVRLFRIEDPKTRVQLHQGRNPVWDSDEHTLSCLDEIENPSSIPVGAPHSPIRKAWEIGHAVKVVG